MRALEIRPVLVHEISRVAPREILEPQAVYALSSGGGDRAPEVKADGAPAEVCLRSRRVRREIEVGLLLNFGRRPEYKRKLYTKEKKDLISALLENP